MYLYFESLTKNLIATFVGLFVFTESVSNGVKELAEKEPSALFLILTIIIPSIISGLVTISIELIKARKGAKK